jgi:ABC-type multidrug transport system ATPase subunit
MFAARLSRDPGETNAQLKKVVADVIKLLELDSLENAMIGSAASSTGISAEAMKRVTMGVELVGSPAILFMDEPTSGCALLILVYNRLAVLAL